MSVVTESGLSVVLLSDLKRKGLVCGVLFQVFWLICIFGTEYFALLAICAFVALYVTFISREPKDFFFASCLALLGYSIDALWLKFGIIEMPQSLPPLWLAMLWCGFSLSLPYAFFFLRHRTKFAIILGGVGGASSYASAIAIRGDVAFGVPLWMGVIYIAMWWAILFPSAMRLWAYIHQRQIAV